ncbi:MAG: hypothetical protein DCC52_13920 [Chloroflexi bacterium]|nr:MAG: hypothetical protein DCC52_13920 [Chloroflexota bacterium]
MTPYETILSQVAWAETTRGVLRVQGADARKWLHKIVTANAEQLETGRGAYSALLDAKGHFVADFILLRDGELYGLLCEAAARAILFQTLKRYIIREKVALADVSERWRCFALVGGAAPALVERLLETRAPDTLYAWTWGRVDETAARVIRTARARVPAFDVMVPVSAAETLRASLQTLAPLTAEWLETLRVEAGLPKWGVDFDDTTLGDANSRGSRMLYRPRSRRAHRSSRACESAFARFAHCRRYRAGARRRNPVRGQTGGTGDLCRAFACARRLRDGLYSPRGGNRRARPSKGRGRARDRTPV